MAEKGTPARMPIFSQPSALTRRHAGAAWASLPTPDRKAVRLAEKRVVLQSPPRGVCGFGEADDTMDWERL